MISEILPSGLNISAKFNHSLCLVGHIFLLTDQGYLKFWKTPQQDAHSVSALWWQMLPYTEEDLC